jgi:predicted RNA-binding protein with TRAM domain
VKRNSMDSRKIIIKDEEGKRLKRRIEAMQKAHDGTKRLRELASFVIFVFKYFD